MGLVRHGFQWRQAPRGHQESADGGQADRERHGDPQRPPHVLEIAGDGVERLHGQDQVIVPAGAQAVRRRPRAMAAHAGSCQQDIGARHGGRLRCEGLELRLGDRRTGRQHPAPREDRHASPAQAHFGDRLRSGLQGVAVHLIELVQEKAHAGVGLGRERLIQAVLEVARQDAVEEDREENEKQREEAHVPGRQPQAEALNRRRPPASSVRM